MTPNAGGEKVLYMAMELSASTWRLGFSDKQKMRQTSIGSRNLSGLLQEVQKAKEKLGLPKDARVVCCYEAGRDGFWIHRFLHRNGIENRVLDAASIEVNRRKRRAKTDRLDAQSLLRVFMRYENGEKEACRVVVVPDDIAEDSRRPHREIERLKKERTAHRNRIRGLLALHGVSLGRQSISELKADSLRTWEGKALPESLGQELQREGDRLKLVHGQIKELEKAQKERVAKPQSKPDEIASKIAQLKGIADVTASTLSREFFSWRKFDNRRQVGALAGLTGTPYSSGNSERDQGISKAGNTRVRQIMTEIAWQWVRHQRNSTLTQWFWRRFGHGTSRMRRVGIIGVARKLLVAIWKYVDRDEFPEGAVMKTATRRKAS